jgi:zinc D-Ala-D-Ala dipeptidase
MHPPSFFPWGPRVAATYDCPVLALALALSLGNSQIAPLVDAADVVPGLRLDIRYATTRNVTGHVIYAKARCLLLPEVAQALTRVQASLAKQGLGLLVWDCYRPLSAQRELWRVYPHPGFVANPKTGSNHNRGVAVDLTLADAKGQPVAMPTDFDSFDSRAYAAATEGIPEEARHNREILQTAMRAEGFRTIRKEWWHFDAPKALGYPLLDVPL